MVVLSLQRHRVALVSDFFYPSIGGVEHHIYALAQCLVEQGHAVIVITNQHSGDAGVQLLAGGLKVYYLPFSPTLEGCMMPTGIRTAPCLRAVLKHERITVVHTHAVCTMSFETIMLASLMGYNVVHTEHSNYGVGRMRNLPLNKLQQLVLTHTDAIITVSASCKENVVARCKIEPDEITVIPNAFDASRFQPARSNIRPKGGINIVILQRLVWRKGAHLLVEIVPEICRRFPYVHFIIGGDGPRRRTLEEMRAHYGLHDRVELLGAVDHRDAPSVLTRGHIFLSTSLTEAFGISILEAISCGLTVISTRAGGVAEELPPHMVHLAEANTHSLIHLVGTVVSSIRASPRATNESLHSEIALMFRWSDVAARTSQIYDRLSSRARPPALRRVAKLVLLDPFTGCVALTVALIQSACLALLCMYSRVTAQHTSALDPKCLPDDMGCEMTCPAELLPDGKTMCASESSCTPHARRCGDDSVAAPAAR